MRQNYPVQWTQRVCCVVFLTVMTVGLAVAAESGKPQVAAHRGASGYLPENTLPAKAMAHAMDVDYIEQDVVLTKDGVAVILHDVFLDSVTDVAVRFPDRKRADGRYYVNDFTLAEIKDLRVSERFHTDTGKPYFKGRFPKTFAMDYRIPTLEEEFIQIQGLNTSRGKNIGVYVEVKEPAYFEEEGQDVLKTVIGLMTQYGYNDKNAKAILQIFDYEAVKQARALGWKGQLAMLVTATRQGMKDDSARHAWLTTDEGIKDVAQYATIYAPQFNLMMESANGQYKVNDLAERARKAGMQVHSWTHRVDDLPEIFASSDEMLDVAFKYLKLDGLFSDFPDVVIAYLRQNSLR